MLKSGRTSLLDYVAAAEKCVFRPLNLSLSLFIAYYWGCTHIHHIFLRKLGGIIPAFK